MTCIPSLHITWDWTLNVELGSRFPEYHHHPSPVIASKASWPPPATHALATCYDHYRSIVRLGALFHGSGFDLPLVLFDNAKFYLSPSSGTSSGSRSNSYECLKGLSDAPLSTSSSLPRTPEPETPSLQATLPSLAPTVTTPSPIQSSLSILSLAPSQTSLAQEPDPTSPSLLDTSVSFARVMDRTGSPASFLTCSSGWDPGILCGAAAFPSLLHSGLSIDNFAPTQESHILPNNFKVGSECYLREAKSSQASHPPSKVPFSVATPFPISPPLKAGEFPRLQLPDLVAPVLPRVASESRLSSPTNSKYSPTSSQTNSPGSEFSLEGSPTSSTNHGPFHWDTVLASLSPSPHCSPALRTAVSEHLFARSSNPTSPTSSILQCHDTVMYFPAQDPIRSVASPVIIPTIVVHNPDSVMVPTQSSVSSIIGLYGGRQESAQRVKSEMPIPKLKTLEDPDPDSDKDDPDGGGSSSESEFEIVAIPALRGRLDAISNTDVMDAENAFGSLMVHATPLTIHFILTACFQTLGSMASRSSSILAAEEQISTEFPTGKRNSSFSSVTEPSIDLTSVFPPSPVVQNNPKLSGSTSFASTAKLCYAQSGTSISGRSTASSSHPTASGSESDCPWLFYVEDGRILEAESRTSLHGGGKFADKLARFPSVPKSPQLTPLSSPFPSPLPSPSPANRHFPDRQLLPGVAKKEPSGTATLETADTSFLLSPCWERNAGECSTSSSHRIPTQCRPTASVESRTITEINFGRLNVDLRLSNNLGSLASDSFPTDSSSSSGYSTKLSTAQSAALSYGRHVRFESADFRADSATMESKQHSPRHRRPPLHRSKTCLKKHWSEKARSGRYSSDASTTLVRSAGPECDHLPSSFSSGSIPKRRTWWQHCRCSVVIRRVRRGIWGCLSLQEDTLGGSVAWATERDYWNDHLPEGQFQRSGNPRTDDGGIKLLRRIRRCS